MQKKQASLISLIFLSIFVTLSFMPIIFQNTYWKNDAPGYGEASKSWTAGVSMYSKNLWLAVIMLILAVISITVMALVYADKKSDFLKFVVYAPAATAVVFAILSAIDILTTTPNGEPGGTATWGYYGFYEYAPAWGFFIECALLTTVTVFDILIARGKLINTKVTISKVSESAPILSEADELKKYKELLDLGVINQEEYDIKKKEILNL